MTGYPGGRALVGVFLLFSLFAPAGRAQMPDSLAAHVQIYTAAGTPATFDEITRAMGEVDVVFVGEEHDDPVAHALQRALLQAAHQRYGEARPVALSLEMFARDVQPVLDEYLAGYITEAHFLQAARPWQNYQSDYRPTVEYARAHGLPVLAANTPRRYVNRVTRLGPASLADLPAEAQRWLPPLPYPGPTEAYQAKWNRLMAEMAAAHPAPHHSPDTTEAAPHQATRHGEPPSMAYLLDAQALWDAGMAHTIARHLMAEPEALVLHLVGGFHVEGGTGTPEALRRYRPGTRSLVVAVRAVDDPGTFERADPPRGDFVVLTDAALPRTYAAGP